MNVDTAKLKTNMTDECEIMNTAEFFSSIEY